METLPPFRARSSPVVNNRSAWRSALYPDRERLFRWQPGYGVFSVSPNHVKAVIAYIRNQKQQHADGKTHDDWERTCYDESKTPDDTFMPNDQN